ncbi:MAG: sensor domain-containing diguanylate cyclase [Acidobacteria bacterium]|nr:sensor domain-containing diguanylate cyclase [Acidobacteriota bacterium]
MIDPPKIAVIYRDRSPEVSAADHHKTPCSIETFEESAVLAGSVSPRPHYLAVLFPEEGVRENHFRLSSLFPGAEIVGYGSSEASAGAPIRRDAGVLSVNLPMPGFLFEYLIQELSNSRLCRRDISSARQRADEIKDLFHAFAGSIAYCSDPVDRKLGMSLLVNRILSQVQAEECVLYLPGEETCVLQRSYSTGRFREIDLFEQQGNTELVTEVFERGKPYASNDCRYESTIPFSRESVRVKSILCYPLLHKGEKLGVIEFLNKVDGVFTTEDRTKIELLLNPLAIAIRNANMFENAERLTITDDLTKLYNYRYLMKYLESDVKRCLRYKKKVSLLFIDVDGFKRINDTFGHLAGSRALAEIGQVFKRIVRETDVVGRYGGDEFVIVLPETPLNGAMVIAERIRKKVEECEFVAQDLSIRLTVSLGVANCPKHTLTAEGLIKKADAAMYRAKELSRNSIKVAV